MVRLNKAFCLFIYITLSFGLLPLTIQAQTTTINGKVIDVLNSPISFASIKLSEIEIGTFTNKDGAFKINIPGNLAQVTLEVSYVGKQTITRKVNKEEFIKLQVFKLIENSLSLDNVEVVPVRKNSITPSSIIFDKEAIEQIQAFSLGEILNNLPGKSSLPPQLQNPQTLTLRTVATGNYAMTNSLGAAIIVDGIRLSNDGNMQNRSMSIHGMASSILGSRNEGSFDVAFQGMDLRDLNVDNIESIEVITGVAPAEYGELTSGAVIIKRQAGKTPWQLNTRINAGSTEFSLSKGFVIPKAKKLGAFNMSVSYLNSNKDPRDKVKSFNRLSTTAMWTAEFSGRIKNTLTVDFSKYLDDVKEDPDDDRGYMTYSKRHSFSASNRISIKSLRKNFNPTNINLSFSRGYQDTYNQSYLNQLPKGVANKDTTGWYEGFFLPGAYLAQERIIGIPINASATINSGFNFSLGNVATSVTYGTDYNFTTNNGPGIVVVADRPRWVQLANQNPRPYQYRDNELNLHSLGFYLQNNMSLPIGPKLLKANIGLRYNIQNGMGNFNPRMNFSLPLNKDLSWSLSYGVSTKSPSLAHRYPAPAWIDIPLLELYNGNGIQSKSLYLVYTQKQEVANQKLKASSSQQFETGLRYNKHKWSTSVFASYKMDKNMFNSYSKFMPLTLPKFNYMLSNDGNISYWPSGDSAIYSAAAYSVVTNGGRSNNLSLEWMLASPKINAIKTSFSTSTSFMYAKSDVGESDQNVKKVSDSYINAGRKAWYGVYKSRVYENWNIMSKFSSDTHIPKLGLVFTIVGDVYWATKSKTLNDSRVPIGYLDKNMEYHAITKFDPTNEDYNYLTLDSYDETFSNRAFIYTVLNMRVAKEIKNKLRVTLSVYNFLNLQPERYNPTNNSYVTYNSPVSITAGINYKF